MKVFLKPELSSTQYTFIHKPFHKPILNSKHIPICLHCETEKPRAACCALCIASVVGDLFTLSFFDLRRGH